MLKKLKLINFRSFDKIELDFDNDINLIIGDNGKGKTNILESIGLLFGNSPVLIPNQNILKLKKESFFVYAEFESNNIINTLSYSYDLKLNKTKILINNKTTTKKEIHKNTLKVSNFFPIDMNLFVLGPKYRRDFIDNTIKNTFFDYNKILKNYENILKFRNKILKNIKEGFSKESELNFWDLEFIKTSELIYKFRINFIDYITNEIGKNSNFFAGDISPVFIYKTKVNLSDITNYITNYLQTNRQRDIIIGKTQIGPHIDDFDILIGDIPINNYASRGETKSIILALKLIELDYINKYTNKKPILLIDDILSELDQKHIDILINKINGYQTISTAIYQIKSSKIHKIIQM